MHFLKKTHIRALSICMICFIFASWLTHGNAGSERDYLGQVHSSITYFGKIYKEVTQKYVDKIEPDKLMHVGIEAMLRAVDDYTALIEDDENTQLQIMTTGRYGGLGMVIGVRNGWPTVMEPPYEHTPALRAGCREGDCIIEIDGISTKDKTVNDVAKIMRGDIGTMVNIKIKRDGIKEPIDFRLIRAEIVVRDVVYSGLIADSIGYIKLARFSKNAAHEVRKALFEIHDQGISALVLDLRNNPGGLLEAAVGVADTFLPKGALIVSTKGREQQSALEYYSESEPIFSSGPLVVLVNENSASASEIVAGAIQDLDRGIIIGQTTFGKGLVQSIININRNARLKITTAKYYLPSGRLIQREHKNENRPDILYSDDENSDSINVVEESFSTATGRYVHGHGGIIPDIQIPVDTLNAYQESLLRQSMIFNYAVYYANTHFHRGVDLRINDDMLEDFRDFLDERNFEFQSNSQLKLKELRDALSTEGLLTDLTDDIAKLEKAVNNQQKDFFKENKEFIVKQLKLELAAKSGGTAAKIEMGFTHDDALKKGLQVLQDSATFYSYLQPKSEM